MGAPLGALFIRLEVIADTEIHAPRLFNFSAGGVFYIRVHICAVRHTDVSTDTEFSPGTAKVIADRARHRQGGSRRQSESPRCLIKNFRPGIGPDQSEWLTLQSNVPVGLIQWDCPWGSVIKPRSRCAPVRACFRTLTSTCRSKSIIVRL